jgi:hypothetical protein
LFNGENYCNNNNNYSNSSSGSKSNTTGDNYRRESSFGCFMQPFSSPSVEGGGGGGAVERLVRGVSDGQDGRMQSSPPFPDYSGSLLSTSPQSLSVLGIVTTTEYY